VIEISGGGPAIVVGRGGVEGAEGVINMIDMRGDMRGVRPGDGGLISHLQLQRNTLGGSREARRRPRVCDSKASTSTSENREGCVTCVIDHVHSSEHVLSDCGCLMHKPLVSSSPQTRGEGF
jgi:hypothetical protein